MKNPIVYALERFYGVSDRTAAGLQHSLERDAELHLQGDLACSAEPSPAQLRRFAIDSMAAMDQLRRFGAIDALVEELSGRQTWLWPFFPKPFSEPEQLQLADRSQVAGAGPLRNRCALLYPDREIFSDPSAVRSRTAALGTQWSLRATARTVAASSGARAYWSFDDASCIRRGGTESSASGSGTR